MTQNKNMTGALFKNDKRDNEKQPNLKGSIIIDNEKYWLSGWTKTDSKNNKYISLSAQKVIGKVQQKLNEGFE